MNTLYCCKYWTPNVSITINILLWENVWTKNIHDLSSLDGQTKITKQSDPITTSMLLWGWQPASWYSLSTVAYISFVAYVRMCNYICMLWYVSTLYIYISYNIKQAQRGSEYDAAAISHLCQWKSDAVRHIRFPLKCQWASYGRFRHDAFSYNHIGFRCNGMPSNKVLLRNSSISVEQR